MRAILSNTLLALAGACLAAGCASGSGQPDQTGGSGDEALSVYERLNNVPGCGDVAPPSPSERLVARHVTAELFLVEDHGAPLCVGDADGVEALSGNVVMSYAAMGPTPGAPGLDPYAPASSNPMPGRDPSAPASSNPMPGTTTQGPR
jgi:hypothetical protein